MRSTRDANHIYQFRAIQNDLEIKLSALEAIDVGELVFATSPTPFARHSEEAAIEVPLAESEPNTGPYALDCRRMCNTSFLELDIWINSRLKELQELDVNNRPKLIDIKSDLEQALVRSLEHVNNLKAKEWGRRYKLQSQARRLVGEGLVRVIDTSK